MPWKSRKQQRWGNSRAGRRKLGAKVVREFNSATRGRKLPTKSRRRK